VFLAGIASFLSPCVLPLVPGYLSYMSGLSVNETQSRTMRLLAATIAFVLGFTTIFVALGMTASILGSFLLQNRQVLTRVSGALIIAMGLVFIGLIPIPWLYSEKRFQMPTSRTVPGSYLMGLAFGAGWSPCIGPALGAALTIAAGERVPGRGAVLLLVYALGLGVPFILSALGVSRLVSAVRWLRSHQRALTLSSGILLIAVGLLFLFDQVFRLSIFIQRAMEASGLDFWNSL
jgi:cytochrome c-type biogenesis protein